MTNTEEQQSPAFYVGMIIGTIIMLSIISGLYTYAFDVDFSRAFAGVIGTFLILGSALRKRN